MAAALPPVLEAPPRCLTSHAVRRSSFAYHGPVLVTEWTFHCATCREDRFEVDHVLARFAEGEMDPIGIATRCIPCGRQAVLFDGAFDGYDGELGHWSQLRGERSQRPLKAPDGSPAGAVRIMVEITYNIALDELAEIGQEASVQVRDLFDWFSFYVAEPGQDWRHVWEWECA